MKAAGLVAVRHLVQIRFMDTFHKTLHISVTPENMKLCSIHAWVNPRLFNPVPLDAVDLMHTSSAPHTKEGGRDREKLNSTSVESIIFSEIFTQR